MLKKTLAIVGYVSFIASFTCLYLEYINAAGCAIVLTMLCTGLSDWMNMNGK